MDGNEVFISHASVDRQLADLFKNTLVLGGIPARSIFYSSARSTGIPIGDDFRRHLRTRLRQSELVIQLITPIFVMRYMCLYEVGAAWVLDLPTYPIVVPPMTRQRAAEYLGETHTGFLGDDVEIEDAFSELSDQIQQRLDSPLKVSDWNEAVRHFKAMLPASLPSDSMSPVPVSDDEPRELPPIRKADDISADTVQDQMAPFLDQIRSRQRKTEVYTRVPGCDAWLGISTVNTRQFGVDYNSIHIYYVDPTRVDRPRLDTFVNWNEGISLARVIEIVRRIFKDDPEKRLMANFNAGQLVEDLKSELRRIAG